VKIEEEESKDESGMGDAFNMLDKIA